MKQLTRGAKAAQTAQSESQRFFCQCFDLIFNSTSFLFYLMFFY